MDDPQIKRVEALVCDLLFQVSAIEARTTALREALARALAKLDDDTPESIELRLIDAERRHLERFLLEFEKRNPSWAAMIDKRDASDLPESDDGDAAEPGDIKH